LTPGGDGMSAIRKIVAGAPERLVAGGTLAVEHGYDQAEAAREILAAACLMHIVTQRDLAGMPRVVAGVAALGQ